MVFGRAFLGRPPGASFRDRPDRAPRADGRAVRDSPSVPSRTIPGKVQVTIGRPPRREVQLRFSPRVAPVGQRNATYPGQRLSARARRSDRSFSRRRAHRRPRALGGRFRRPGRGHRAGRAQKRRQGLGRANRPHSLAVSSTNTRPVILDSESVARPIDMLDLRANGLHTVCASITMSLCRGFVT